MDYTIKELRRKAKWTQGELGMMFTVKKAPEIICRWENGTSKPNAQHLQELSKIFGVSAEKILL